MTAEAAAIALPPWVPWIDRSLLEQGWASDTTTLLHQTPMVTIRKSQFGGTATRVATLSFRSSNTENQHLWQATLRLLERHHFMQPCHPSLVSVLGIADKLDAVPDSSGETSTPDKRQPAVVVMELMETSLYDALHVDKLELPGSDILFIATEILSTLDFLHRSGQSFGSTLTSRKVMFGGARHVKLRRFCSEWIFSEVKTRSAASMWNSQYAMPHSQEVECLSPLQREQRKDLYAFGVVLLEMCAGCKPTTETLNRVSLAGRVDPRIESVIRTALMVEGASSAGMQRRLATLLDPHELMTLCKRVLNECRSDLDSSQMQFMTTSHSFKSFLHADRFLLAREEQLVEQRVAERTSQSTTALKRLAAVEADLVDEQRNFEIVVKQLEQLRLEKATDEGQIRDLLVAIRQHQVDFQTSEHVATALTLQLAASKATVERLNREAEDAELQLQRAQLERVAIYSERQELRMDVLRLQDERRAILDQKHEVERLLADMSAKVDGEKEALEELDARWRQAIRRCEQEQQVRRATERQMETIAQQLTTMEDERSCYTAALQIAPTRQLDARSSQSLVLELKDKEVQSLRDDVHRLVETLSDTKTQLARSEANCSRLESVVCVDLQDHINSLQRDSIRLENSFLRVTEERDALHMQLAQASYRLEEANTAQLTLEAQVGDLHKQIADAERARRLRQCLTPNCDAPRYLVKASGLCIDCEEKMAKDRGKSRASPASPQGRASRAHRRQRSLDGVCAILNNSKNNPITDLIKRIEVGRDCDDENRDESALELVAAVKQLGKLLKDSASLKEDIPECGAFRSLLAVMEQFIACVSVVMECCKTLSIAVFNHDRNRLILVAEGAVEIVLRMLKEFPREIKVQEVGAVLLTNLSHNCESNRQRILTAGGLDAVLGLMQSFPRNKSVQKKSCWALLTLAGSDIMCDKIASLGGIGATLAAMLNCPDDEDVQHYGCWALLNMISGTRHLQEFARQEGVGEVVEAARACFTEHVGIQNKSRDVLELLYTADDTST